MHMEHSLGGTMCQAIKSLINLKGLKSYKVCSLTIMELHNRRKLVHEVWGSSFSPAASATEVHPTSLSKSRASLGLLTLLHTCTTLGACVSVRLPSGPVPWCHTQPWTQHFPGIVLEVSLPPPRLHLEVPDPSYPRERETAIQGRM